MRQPKLILLNGPPGVGKSTIAKRYIDEHPLALIVDDDQLLVMLGQWQKHEERSRKLIFKLAVGLIEDHLQSGHDVIVPYLTLYKEEITTLETLAIKHNAQFCACTLLVEKTQAVHRLMKRGTWGEADLPPLSEHDIPVIENLYDRMMAILEKQPSMMIIQAPSGDEAGTYQRLLAMISTPA